MFQDDGDDDDDDDDDDDVSIFHDSYSFPRKQAVQMLSRSFFKK